MAEPLDERWPDWSKPATKGDVIAALVNVNSCIVDISIALSAAQRGDQAKSDEVIDSLRERMKKLSELTDEIGGRFHG
jgi:hypothetical protein